MNIFLIGYRCTGKTTLGAALAERLGWRFVDMDDVIVAQSGMTIAQMVARHDWPFFRQQEKLLLQHLAEGKRCVVGTGGGVVLDPDNIDAMRSGGKTIWLRSRPETIRRYMDADERTRSLRPALTDRDLMDEIETTLAAREPLYRRASDLTVDTNDFDIDGLCRKMIDGLKKIGVSLD